MLIVDALLCTMALGAAVVAFTGIRRNLLVPASYLFFSLSPLMDFRDITARAEAGDTGGITDIYPTFFVCYLILLAVITVINVAGMIREAKQDGVVHRQHIR